MSADYDPLTLPAAYFEGLPTGVPNNLPSQPEPVRVVCTTCVDVHGRDTSQAVQCPMCGAVVGCFWHGGHFEHIRNCAQQHTPAGRTRQ